MNQNLLTLTIFLTIHALAAQFTPPQELLIGFKATPQPSIPHFQPLLTDPSFNYSLGFLRVHPNRLTLSILHVPSSVPLWSPDPPLFPKWSHLTYLLFNGSLVLSDSESRVFWSTHTSGDRVFLSNTSNLQIVKFNRRSVVWQSFDFPSDTLVENQNFTSSMALISSNRVYSMLLGPNFIGLYAKFHKSDQIYLRHRALEAKGEIVPGRGPVYAVLKSGGYLGLFQSGSDPVDVQSFNSFQQNVAGVRRVRIESDGNLRGYYWTGLKWVLDYKAISDPCELPSFCGEYGLCTPGSGCSCLDNRTVYGSGGCGPPENQFTGDFCGGYDFRHKRIVKAHKHLAYNMPDNEIVLESADVYVFEDTRGFSLVGFLIKGFPGMEAVEKLVNSWNMRRTPIKRVGSVFISRMRLALTKSCKGVFVAPMDVCCKVIPEYFLFKDKDMRYIPIWVQLHGLPLEYWNGRALGKIASCIRKPVRMDDKTCSRTHISFAMVLVEIVSTAPLPLSMSKIFSMSMSRNIVASVQHLGIQMYRAVATLLI